MLTAQKKWDYNITNLTKVYKAFVGCVSVPDFCTVSKNAGTLTILARFEPGTIITLSAFVDVKTIVLTSATENINTNNNFAAMCAQFEAGLA